MPDSELYKKLKTLDPKVAQIYFHFTKDDPKAVITYEAIATLFNQLLDQDGAITSQELDALILIIEGCTFDQDALEFERMAVIDTRVAAALGKGVGKVLKTDKELDSVYKALDLAGERVNFTSPGTGFTYDASKFQAIKKLVKDRAIEVIEVNDRGIVSGKIRPKGRPAGGGALVSYNRRLDPPRVTFFAGAEGAPHEHAHELTHAIQDWLNSPAPIKYWETDAYIVEGLMFRAAVGKPISPSHPIAASVEVIVANRATNANKDWPKTYEAAADAIVSKGWAQGSTEGGVKSKERLDKLTKILQAMQKAKAKPAPGAPAAAKPAPAKPAPAAPKK
ncbi:hypothetical protein [Bradyrhizobium prioriisuperbiae]|uniref:hypothetical protein n=1 Tax=Bradyrhizobium prioriisuperbiae TaxID=2854389 RepID=UPI0028E79575|nr:hypothetical protein [Bradyrhizobium prioritasuperba]